MSKDLRNPISSGRTSEIYDWDQEHVLKLFHDWVGLESIENEARVTRAIYESGLPVPEVGEIIRLEARYGLIYQRITGKSMFKLGQHKPWNIPRYLRRAAELHAEIHSQSISADLPLQRKILETNIRQAVGLPTLLRSRALAVLEALPDGSQLCHGDFWPGNILMTPHGEVIIDWYRASRGNPLADLARTTNAVLGFLVTNQFKRAFLSYGTSKLSQVENSVFRAAVRTAYPIYIRRYFQIRPGGEAEYRRWLPVVAAARLIDEIPELDGLLMKEAEQLL